jgi:predicted nucleotidyltransferase component of viral defense system
VLGWLLAAASQHAVVREHWILKGGTCVKKCFFETYRFSEDLDFSLLPAAPKVTTLRAPWPAISAIRKHQRFSRTREG